MAITAVPRMRLKLRLTGPTTTTPLRRPTVVLSCAYLAALVVVAIAAPLVGPGPLTQHFSSILSAPSWHFPFGTDELGRSIWSRVIYGTREALIISALSSVIAGVVGVAIGLTAGYIGSALDAVAMRVIDLLLAMPAIVLAMVAIALFGRSTFNLIMTIAVVSVPQIALLARSGAISVKPREFVLASQVAGARRGRTLLRTILPNVMLPIISQVAITAETAILLAAALDFLGLGTPPPTPTWGQMLSSSQLYLSQAPWYGIFPGLALTLTTLSLDTIVRGIQRTIQFGKS